MPAPPMMGPGPSGMDTSKTIQQLMKLERVPIQRIHEENKEHELMIKAWEEVRALSMDLERKSRELYSFAGPFALKKIESSDPGAITGEASPRVQDTNQTIEVVQLAGNHQIHSNPISTREKLPPGEFTLKVGDREHKLKFRGGSLHSLVQLIENEAGEDFEVFEVRVDSENSLLGFRSKRSGEEGRLQFTDPDGLLRKIGLIGDLPAREQEEPLSLKKESLTPYSGPLHTSSLTGGYGLAPDGSSLSLKGDMALRLKNRFGASSVLQMEARATGSESRADSPDSSSPGGSPSGEGGVAERARGEGTAAGSTTIQEKVTVGPDISLDVEDVHLEGYNISRSRERRIPHGAGAPAPGSEASSGGEGGSGPGQDSEQKARELASARGGLLVVWEEQGSEQRSLVPLERLQEGSPLTLGEITGGKEVSSLIFFSRKGSQVEFRDVKIRKSEKGSVGPLHVTEEGRDARLRVNGVEITRPKNREITDIIEGVSLNLNRVTRGPVEVNVRADTEKIVTKIHEWVDSYNKLLRFLRDNNGVGDAKEFKMNRPDRSEEDLSEGLRKLKANSGVFASDSTVRKLVFTLREISGGAYPASYEPGYRVLNDVGISTGGAGKSWEEIKKGYLEVDEEKLIQALTRSSLSVKELFASDTNEDSRVDNGAAYQMSRSLKAYTRFTGGLISIRIDLLKTKVSDNKERIDRLELSLKSKEESLRRRFGRMEEAVRQSRSMGNYLKNNLRAPSGN